MARRAFHIRFGCPSLDSCPFVVASLSTGDITVDITEMDDTSVTQVIVPLGAGQVIGDDDVNNGNTPAGYVSDSVITGLQAFTQYKWSATQNANPMSGTFWTMGRETDDFAFVFSTCEGNNFSVDAPQLKGWWPACQTMVGSNALPIIGQLHIDDHGYWPQMLVDDTGFSGHIMTNTVMLQDENITDRLTVYNYTLAAFSMLGLFGNTANAPIQWGNDPDREWGLNNVNLWPKWGDWDAGLDEARYAGGIYTNETAKFNASKEVYRRLYHPLIANPLQNAELREDFGWYTDIGKARLICYDGVTHGTADGYQAYLSAYPDGVAITSITRVGKVVTCATPNQIPVWAGPGKRTSVIDAEIEDYNGDWDIYDITSGGFKFNLQTGVEPDDIPTPATAKARAAGPKTLLAPEIDDICSTAINHTKPWTLLGCNYGIRFQSSTHTLQGSGCQNPMWDCNQHEYKRMFTGVGHNPPSFMSSARLNGKHGQLITLHGDHHQMTVFKHEAPAGDGFHDENFYSFAAGSWDHCGSNDNYGGVIGVPYNGSTKLFKSWGSVVANTANRAWIINHNSAGSLVFKAYDGTATAEADALYTQTFQEITEMGNLKYSEADPAGPIEGDELLSLSQPDGVGGWLDRSLEVNKALAHGTSAWLNNINYATAPFDLFRLPAGCLMQTGATYVFSTNQLENDTLPMIPYILATNEHLTEFDFDFGDNAAGPADAGRFNACLYDALTGDLIAETDTQTFDTSQNAEKTVTLTVPAYPDFHKHIWVVPNVLITFDAGANYTSYLSSIRLRNTENHIPVLNLLSYQFSGSNNHPVVQNYVVRDDSPIQLSKPLGDNMLAYPIEQRTSLEDPVACLGRVTVV